MPVTARPPDPAEASAPWWELRVTCPQPAQDAVCGILWDLDSQGIAERETPRNGQPWSILQSYLRLDDPGEIDLLLRQRLDALEPFFPGTAHGRISIRPVEEKDWNAVWKEHFAPCRVSPRIVIRPTWTRYVPEAGDLVIDIDPGMAFGTGTHETTRACLKAIDALYADVAPPSASRGSHDAGPVRGEPARSGPARVLDVGTGSGILLIAAMKLGALEGIGIDIDPLSIDAARRNCAANKVLDQVMIAPTPLEQVTGTFDLILANILAPTLIALAPELARRLVPKGVLVLSGLLTHQEGSVLAAFEEQGIPLLQRLREGEWSTLVLEPASR